MEKYLITGFSGFVAQHFLVYLNQIVNEKTSILGIDIVINDTVFEDTKKLHQLEISTVAVDMLDYTALEKVVFSFSPTRILHLASFSSVSQSWLNPSNCFINNTNIFLNLIEIVKKCSLKPRILSVGSSEEYGIIAKEFLPLKEEQSLNPSNPYAIARVSQEMLSQCYQKAFNIDIVLTRSFNHIGPKQKDIFVISHYLKEVAKGIKQKQKEITLYTGNTDIIRDFLDVRDVVRAYYLLFEKGISGEIYNVCSGNGVSLKGIINLIEQITGINVNCILDKSLIRPIDNEIIIGSNRKITNLTRWKPEITIEKSLNDILNYWLSNITEE